MKLIKWIDDRSTVEHRRLGGSYNRVGCLLRIIESGRPATLKIIVGEDFWLDREEVLELIEYLKNFIDHENFEPRVK